MITQNLYDYISKYKTEFFEEVKCFLEGLKLYNHDFEYSTLEVLNVFSNEPSSEYVLKTFFRVSFIKALELQSQTLNSLKVEVVVKKNKVTETKHRNFWGKETIDRRVESEIVRYECRPFIFDYSKSVYGFNSYPSLTNYIKLEDLESLSSFFGNEEKVVFSKVVQFLYDIIAKYNVAINASENNIVEELSKINIDEITKDSKGIDIDFKTLISKNQTAISLIDRNYVHNFIRLSNFIKVKKQNILEIHTKIIESVSTVDKLELINILNNQIYSFNLIIIHSLSMLSALIDNDMVTFFEIYESFDKLNVFNSNWENEVSEKLTDIGDKLDDLMLAIYNMEQTMLKELQNLSYMTQDSFANLHRSVNSQLAEINSSINTNNLLSGIQAYQLYKINRNTKGIR
jgi:hypothetical protein